MAKWEELANQADMEKAFRSVEMMFAFLNRFPAYSPVYGQDGMLVKVEHSSIASYLVLRDRGIIKN